MERLNFWTCTRWNRDQWLAGQTKLSKLVKLVSDNLYLYAHLVVFVVVVAVSSFRTPPKQRFAMSDHIAIPSSTPNGLNSRFQGWSTRRTATKFWALPIYSNDLIIMEVIHEMCEMDFKIEKRFQFCNFSFYYFFLIFRRFINYYI